MYLVLPQYYPTIYISIIDKFTTSVSQDNHSSDKIQRVTEFNLFSDEWFILFVVS